VSTAEARVAQCLERIRAREPEIRAWQYLAPEASLERARALDRIPPRGPLHGIPIGIKDVLDTNDMPTEYGSSIYKGHQPQRDSNFVKLLRDSGAIIVGKTRTTEFASPIPVDVRNPLDFSRTPGVSSSGSAAAVADGMVPIALGTQTGGSVIRPAAYCGIYGYKASLDALDRGGIRHLRPTLDTLGVLARSLDDIALVQGSEIRPPEGKPRLGFCRTGEWRLARPETRQALLRAADKLGAEEVELPALFAEALESFRVIVLRESAIAYASEFRDHLDAMNDWMRNVAAEAATITDGQYARALDHAAQCRVYLAEVFRTVDALITPAAAGEASQKLTGLEDQSFCPLWTLMHGPCVTLPVFEGPHGMPMGIQIVGAVNADARLLATARWSDSALKM
jgi:Asp-tRNA(Asn)/Glu-tRNA(Gln) amidotransferase A subunit family amidase